MNTDELSKLEYVLPVFVTTLECGLLDGVDERGSVFLSKIAMSV